MSTAIIKANAQLPAAVAKLAGLANVDTLAEMSGGVQSGFPIIGYKGKVWSIRTGGESQMYLDANGNAMPQVNLVLVKANPNPSKIFYDKAYEEGTNDTPRCFSNDGIKPDASIQQPIHPVCASCPNNVWGSKITANGKKTRACADARRMAVVFADDLYEMGEKAVPHLLRVPAASLNPLKDYAEKVLAAKGIPFFAIVTGIGFEPTAAHPQFMFKGMRFLNDEEADAVIALRESPDVSRILAEPEFAVGGTAADTSEAPASYAGTATPPSAPASASTPPAAGARAAPAAPRRPATEEEAGFAAAPPPPSRAAAPLPPQPASTPAAEPAPAPAPRKKRAPAAAPAAAPAPAPVAAAPQTTEEEEETAQPVTPAQNGRAAPPDFDNLLDSILNG